MLTGLPSGIFDKNTKLTQLVISRNLMTTLPSGIFDQLTSLSYLCVASPILSSRSHLKRDRELHKIKTERRQTFIL